MLTGITTTDLRRRSINLDWLVELLRRLPKAGVRVVLRAWESGGVLGRFDLSVKLVSDARVLSVAPRTVRNTLRHLLREEALRTSAEWIRNILFAYFDHDLASDDPVRIAHAEGLAETLARSQANYARTLRHALQRRLLNNRSVMGKRIKGALHTLNADNIMLQRTTLERDLIALPLIDQLRTVADSPLPVGRFSPRIAESGLAIVSALPDVLRRQLVLRLRPQHNDAWVALRRAVQQLMLLHVVIPPNPTH